MRIGTFTLEASFNKAFPEILLNPTKYLYVYSFTQLGSTEMLLPITLSRASSPQKLSGLSLALGVKHYTEAHCKHSQYIFDRILHTEPY